MALSTDEAAALILSNVFLYLEWACQFCSERYFKMTTYNPVVDYNHAMFLKNTCLNLNSATDSSLTKSIVNLY